MPTEADPIIGNWYCHFDKGQRFFVVAIDEGAKTVEVQHFDGNLEEFDIADWYELDIDTCEAPENWSGPLDVGNIEDLGNSVTDTRASDWDDPLDEFETRDDKQLEE